MDPIIGAVDIGGSKVALGLVSERGEVRSRRTLPTAPLCRSGLPGLEQVRYTLAEMAHDAHVQMCGIGISCTGPVDPATGRIGDVEPIRGWSRLSLADVFAASGVPVAVENDADSSALAELAWGSGVASRRLIYVTISTGIGCGLVFDGALYRGAAGAHPEIGHHIVDVSGPECYCGANGCWESLASGPAMTSWFERETGRPGLTAEDICGLARTGDGAALRAVERTGFYLGAGLNNLMNIFAPDTIALGGGLMISWDLLATPALNVIRRCCTQVPSANTRIVPAALGIDLPVLGAARTWLHRYKKDNS